MAAQGIVVKGFQASVIQKKINALVSENKDLEYQATSLQSLQNLKDSVTTQNSLVPVQNLKHILSTGFTGNSVGQK